MNIFPATGDSSMSLEAKILWITGGCLPKGGSQTSIILSRLTDHDLIALDVIRSSFV